MVLPKMSLTTTIRSSIIMQSVINLAVLELTKLHLFLEFLTTVIAVCF